MSIPSLVVQKSFWTVKRLDLKPVKKQQNKAEGRAQPCEVRVLILIKARGSAPSGVEKKRCVLHEGVRAPNAYVISFQKSFLPSKQQT